MCCDCGGIGGAWWPEPDEDDFIEEVLSESEFNSFPVEELKKKDGKQDSDDLSLMDIFYFLEDFCDSGDEDDFEEFEKNITGDIVTVKYNDDLIGCAQFDFADNLGCVYLRNIVIHEDYRRMGLGTDVFKYVKSCIGKEFDKIIIESDFVKKHEGAYDFFKMMGFKEDSDKDVIHTYSYDLAADRICKY